MPTYEATKATEDRVTRYQQDADGQWWYYQHNRSRTRAHEQICANCDQPYIISVYHRRKSQCCSRRCAGIAKTTIARGPGSRRWNGGIVGRRGYILIYAPDHPSGNSGKYQLEHRLVMEGMLGRILEKNEYVHHKNGMKDDNRPENLELWVGGHPPGQRADERKHCPTCTCSEHSKEDSDAT